MAIEIEKRFSLDAPVEQVWTFLVDLERVASCLKGASIGDRDDDGVWSGTMKVKLGPVSSTYRGTARFLGIDEEARTAELSAEGRDTRGKGGADMTMRSELTESGRGTEVHVASTVHVTGVLARMGRGMIEDVSDQLFEQFTACVREKLEGAAEAKAGVATPPRGEPAAPEGRTGPDAPVGEAPTRHRGSTPDAPAAAADEEEALQLGGMGGRAVARALGRTLRKPLVWALVALILLAAWAVMSG